MKLRILAATALCISAFLPGNISAENNGGQKRAKTEFAWGAAAGGCIDLTGNDMSDINFSAFFGIRRGWINFLGVGAEADIVAANSCRSYPLFMEFRTNFINRPSIFFWWLRAGASLNYLEHNHQQTGAYGSTGLGINLARSKSFCSHLFIGYSYRNRRTITGPEMTHNFKDLHFATFKIGITF